MHKFYNEVEKMDSLKTQIWLTPMTDHLPYVPSWNGNEDLDIEF